MKRKLAREHKPRFARIGIALIVVPLCMPLLALSLFAGIMHYEDAPLPAEGRLIGAFTANAPAAALLSARAIAQAPVTLYLAGWSEPGSRHCLSLVGLADAPGYARRYLGMERKTACVIRAEYPAYSIAQFWWSRPEEAPVSAVFGYSGAATGVSVTWQDGAVSAVAAENGVFLAYRLQKSRTIASVAFYDADGGLLAQIPESAAFASRRQD